MIAVTGGGTGGHLTIAKSIKEELNKRGIKPVFIRSLKGQDRAWFEDDDGWSDRYFLDSSGVARMGFTRKIKALLAIIKLAFKARKILKKHGVLFLSTVPTGFFDIFLTDLRTRKCS